MVQFRRIAHVHRIDLARFAHPRAQNRTDLAIIVIFTLVAARAATEACIVVQWTHLAATVVASRAALLVAYDTSTDVAVVTVFGALTPALRSFLFPVAESAPMRLSALAVAITFDAQPQSAVRTFRLDRLVKVDEACLTASGIVVVIVVLDTV